MTCWELEHSPKLIKYWLNQFCKLLQDSESLKKGEADISLEIVPRNHPLVKMTELREEGGSTLESLLTLIASHTISRLDLTAALSDECELWCLKNHSKQFGCFSEHWFAYTFITSCVAWSLLKSIPIWDKCLHERGVLPGYPHVVLPEKHIRSQVQQPGVSLWQASSFWIDGI